MEILSRNRLFGILLPIGALLLCGCPPTTVKQLLEERFSDFRGLDNVLARDYIVGLQTAPDFINLHCCWVGDRSGWQRISGRWDSGQESKVAAGALALLQRFSAEVSLDHSSYVTLVAEDLFEDRLENLRHFQREHCTQHDTLPCATEICTLALKVGTVSVATLTKVVPSPGPEQIRELRRVELGSYSYIHDPLVATDLIVGYQKQKTSCGEHTGWENALTPSAAKQKIEVAGSLKLETYADHFRRFQSTMETRNQARLYGTRLPAEPLTMLPPLQAQAIAVLGPPPEQITAGQSIRLTAVNQMYQPSPDRDGLAITEVDAQGKSRTRLVRTDLRAGAWVMVGSETKDLFIHLGEEEIYSRPTRPREPVYEKRPLIESVKPFQSEGPEGMVESGSLAQILGSNLGPATQILVAGKPQVPLVSGTNYVVGHLEGIGPTRLAVRNGQGLTSPNREITLLRISTEQVPPSIFRRGQKTDIVLRIEGTMKSIPIDFAINSKTMHFLDGNQVTTTTSTGGSRNLVRVTIQAQGAGPYKINFRLAASKTKP